jgi:UDP-galactopyranose mutase
MDTASALPKAQQPSWFTRRFSRFIVLLVLGIPAVVLNLRIGHSLPAFNDISKLVQPELRVVSSDTTMDAASTAKSRTNEPTIARPPRIAYITYTYFSGGSAKATNKTKQRFKIMVQDALETWLSDEPHYFVVMTRESFTLFEDLCKTPQFESSCQRIIPIAVDCPEGYYGDAPCCKMQEGLLAIREKYPDYDWYYYADDDMYMRTAYLRDFLQPLRSDSPMILTSGPFKRLGQSGFQLEPNEEQTCGTSHDYLYPWGQPIIYSTAALDRVSQGFKMNGFRAQCKSFHVTHDVGNQIWNWMYQMPEVRLPHIPLTTPGHWRNRRASPGSIGCHGVSKEGLNALTMKELHDSFSNQTYPAPPYQYHWHNTTAFKQTETYRKHGDISTWKKWHTMPVEDCRGPDPHKHKAEQQTSSKQEQLRKISRQAYDVCVVGAGLSGAVIAQNYADMGKKVLVLEKRSHIGGNCFDYTEKETGIRVSKYGAHLFHTTSKRVWDYVRRFTDWTEYEHKVIALVNNTYVPVPVNIDTVNALFGLKIRNETEMDIWLAKEQVHYNETPRNSEEMALSRVGPRLYELIFHPYTIKQWAREPVNLGPEVTARIPVRNSTDGRYFSDPYQFLPTRGYTEMFRNLFRNLFRAQEFSIELHLNMDYFEVRDSIKCSRTYFTGPIDAYFAHLKWKKLEYRSLTFEQKVVRDTNQFQPAFVVNHPALKSDFTRIVEYKHLPNQSKSNHTVIFVERSSDVGEPYYPVPNDENKKLYAKYKEMAMKETNVTFVGRLANYKYFNMDEAILNALELFDRDRDKPWG